MKRVHQRETDFWEPKTHVSCLSILEWPRAGSSPPITPSAIWKTKAAAQLSLLLAKCVINLKLEEKVKFAIWQGSGLERSPVCRHSVRHCSRCGSGNQSGKKG